MIDDQLQRFSLAVSAYEADDMAVAFQFFEALANEGNAGACQYLGLMFKTGDGVVKDIAIAKFWYAKHRNLLQERTMAGNADATLSLAKLYQYGDNVEVNWQKALLLIRRAAESGHSGAQFHLATIHKYAWCGCEQDLISYSYWLNEAVAKGHAEALYMRGIELAETQHGRETGIDHVRKAASKGFWPAQQWLCARE